ncbi:MAG: ABC transporter ATP-binding protein [Desulfurococcales archaeon]|nr:ABC transporter ATP-binding protein [Desulfurococcales archaeon]
MLLRVSNLRKYFNGIRAVDEVSFTLDNNTILAVIGPNGAGKTTLINLISGYILPDSGKIEYLGRDITHYPPYRRLKMGIARSFQIVNLFDQMPVIDNVRIAMFSSRNMIRKMFAPIDIYKDIREEAIKILEVFGLAHRMSSTPKELSEGERKMLDIAIAYATKPRLLLMDEPTSGVATKDRFKIMDTIIDVIRTNKLSAIVVEHDLDVVSSYADNVLVLSEGKILTIGKPSEVLEDPSVKRTLFGVI